MKVKRMSKSSIFINMILLDFDSGCYIFEHLKYNFNHNVMKIKDGKIDSLTSYSVYLYDFNELFWFAYKIKDFFIFNFRYNDMIHKLYYNKHIYGLHFHYIFFI